MATNDKTNRRIERKNTRWHLVAVQVSSVWFDGYNGKVGLTLTPEQDAKAIEILRENYHRKGL